ncbi:HEAT repeat domain-containing protein [Nostoc sp. CHAB 5834]|nr:HEAT repeat domain-containing protein [Nostoc sp. CHAB 5834]
MLIQAVKKKTILVLVANPNDTTQLALPEEIDQLKQSLTSLGQDRFQLEWEINVKEEDWLKHISRVKPQIVHFCGHGTKTGLIVHGDKKGEKYKELSNQYLANLLKEFSNRVECVVLNACDTEPLAIALTQHINYAIGMNRPVKDKYAIPFAKYFYNQLGIGESVETAFNLAINEVFRISSPDNINSSSEDDDRKLAVVGVDGSPVKHQNPDYSIPVLKINPNPIEIKSLWLSPEHEKKAIGQLLAAIADSFKTISLFHAKEPIVLQDQYVPIQVTLERRYQHTVETIGGYAESEAELKRIYALKGSSEEEIKRQQVDWQVAKGQEKRIVVLADPGMGKSTLLRMEVCTTVEQSHQALVAGHHEAIAIPLLIRLSTLADRVTELSTEEAILKIIQERHSQLLINHDNAEMGAFLNEFLRKQLLSGKCLLLLDALDEVPSGKRPQLLERLNDFVHSYPTCAIVATSRIVGYGGRLVDGAKDMEIVPFTQLQTEQYIETWFKNAQKFLKDESVSARGLIQALRERPQIAGLAQNPLLLSLICSLYQRDKLTLPARRSQIYEQAVTCMLGEWSQTRAGHEDDRTQAKMRLLEALAYHFTCESQEVFDYEDLYDWVEAYLEDGDAPRDLRDDKPGKLIADLSEQDGILQKLYQDDNQYLFLHRTFQEYFTASYLNRVLRKKPSDGVALVKQYLWNYDWHETLTLLAGLMKKPMVLIEAIAGEKDDIFQTQLLLAGRCIAECSQISDPLIDQLIDRIYQFWQKYPGAEFIQSVVVAVGRNCFRMINNLKTAFKDDEWDIKGITKILGQIGSQEAMDVLIEIIEDKSNKVRYKAVEALGQIGIKKSELALKEALKDKDTKPYAVNALLQIGSEYAVAVKALIEILEDLEDNDRLNRMFAAGLAGKFGCTEAIPALIEAHSAMDLPDPASNHPLTQLCTEETLPILLEALKHESVLVRIIIPSVIGKIGSAKAVPDLIEAFKNEVERNDYGTARRMSEALVELGSKEFVPVLIEALENKNYYIRENAAEALGKIASKDSVPALIKAFKNKNLNNEHKAEEALIKIGSRETVSALIGDIESEDEIVRNVAVRALEEIGTKEAIEALKTENENLRKIVKYRLSKIGTPDVLQALIEALKDEDTNLGKIAKYGTRKSDYTTNVIQSLTETLKDEDYVVRKIAVKVLGEIRSIDTVPAFIEAFNDEAYDISEFAAKTLREIGTPDALQALIEATKDHGHSRFTYSTLALETLAKPSSPEAVLALIEAFKYVRFGGDVMMIISVLGEIRTPEAYLALIEVLKGEGSFKNTFKEYAIKALGNFGNQQAIEALIEALGDSNSSILRSTVKALEKIGNAETITKLIQNSDLNIYCTDIFILARKLAIRFSKAGSPYIPVYPELLPIPVTTDGAEA